MADTALERFKEDPDDGWVRIVDALAGQLPNDLCRVGVLDGLPAVHRCCGCDLTDRPKGGSEGIVTG